MKTFTDLIKLKEPLIISEYNTGQIHNWSNQEQNELKEEIGALLEVTYPKMPDDERKIWSSGFFKQHQSDYERYVLVLRNAVRELIGAALYDCGFITFQGNPMKSIYLISITVMPYYQSRGIGKAIGVKLINEIKPDLLFSSCTQSQMLHCCVALSQKRLVEGYDVYPRLELKKNKTVLITVPPEAIEWVKDAFKQIYLNLVGGDIQEVEKALMPLSDTLIRRNMFGSRFDFDPWAKDGREDALARALDLRIGDGILVMLKKQSKGCP